ncbi:hypothetical protein HYW46_02425 [Candidatus Daviesbacteria bacterium]|nr:hypothetical protein [Candidatus Daviesbacteria bacterium]
MNNIASNSAVLFITSIPSSIGNLLQDNTFQIVLSAFLGGFFAALFSNYFESRRRINQLRRDKYFDHRNTVVQIEHELIPVRVNMSRNIASVEDALQNTNDNNIRIILRFYNISISTGLSLKLLNLDLINEYAEAYSMVESLNSDFQYTNGVVNQIIEDHKQGKIDFSKIGVYLEMLNYLKYQCDLVDKKTLNLLSMCKVAIRESEEKKLSKYLKEGMLINYDFDKKTLSSESKKVEKEEKRDVKNGMPRPKFVALYLDFRRQAI